MGYCEGRSLELEFSSLKRLFVLYKELQVGFEPIVTAPLLHARVWLRYNIMYNMEFFGILGMYYIHMIQWVERNIRSAKKTN